MGHLIGDELVATNPATGEPLGRVKATQAGEVAKFVAAARTAQHAWGLVPWPTRRPLLKDLYTQIARERDDWARLIRDEVGKPIPEAMAEVVTTLDCIRWTIDHAPKALRPERIGAGFQRFLLMPPARLSWMPVGVIGIIGTWNYPLFLNLPCIVQAIAAGNAVVWKPSEHAALVGAKIRDALARAAFPDRLVATIFGGPDVGRSLAEAEIDKGVFTGGVGGGRAVLATLAARGVPAIAELSGFDAAIVLDDAPFEATVNALTWSAFVNAGQTCVAVKRAIIVGDSRPWAKRFAERAQSLRLGNPATDEIDVGPMITREACAQLESRIRDAVEQGAELLAGGRASEAAGSFFPPTVLLVDDAQTEARLEGVFGPLLIVRGVADMDAAIAAANSSTLGLAASVWGKDKRRARLVAEPLRVGVVSINDAVSPAGHAAAPFGGCKASGYGRTKGLLGLREFQIPVCRHERSARAPRPQLYPYSDRLPRLLGLYSRLRHRG